MTTIDTTHDTDPIAQLAAAPIPFDLYREVHKGLRKALFDLTTSVGSADCQVAADREAVVAHVHRVIALLHTHHGHEDTFIQPLLDAHAPTLAAMIEDGHGEVDADIVDLELAAEKLAGTDGGDAVAAGHALYGRLALFTASYLAHMALEEGGVMEALRAAMSLGDLFDVEMTLRGSVAPPTMCDFIAVMVPAMNPAERTTMLGGMHAGAPAEVFELFRGAAEAALGADDYAALARAIGIA
jgi:hypothetical protein